MFGFFAKMRQRKLEALIAIMQGEIMGIYIVVGSIINRIPEAERGDLINVLKAAVGRGFGGNADILPEEYRSLYNNSMSGILQRFIGGQSAPDFSNL